MALSARRNRTESAYYWPGFVDAMATLLLVIIFLLSIFMLAQFMLAREITGQDSVLSQLKSQISELTELLALEKAARANSDVTLAALTDKLKLAQTDNERLIFLLEDEGNKSSSSDAALAALRAKIEGEKQISSEALARVELLNQQISALRRQISTLNAALEASEARDKDSRTQIVDLGRRLNAALAQRVQELARFRSEFFGRLRKIMAGREGIRVVGDRFVFQSEVLFSKGAAEINPLGEAEIDKLAAAIKELEQEIPEDINWVLRVDGHTDIDPINTPQFQSNWELSAARAIAVVKLLVDQGIPPRRLVAAGFGEFQPIDDADTDEAKSKNRRIELKLTER
ncbi:MAG: peptidoglycan -binding protein [Hyphomicrobiales bacterium]